MVSLRRHFVPNPVVIHSTCRGSRRRQPLSIHTRYDAEGDKLSETDPDKNKTTYGYDGYDELASQSQTITVSSGTSVTATTTYNYDADGNLLQAADADANANGGTGTGSVIVYAYNSVNEETSETWYNSISDANDQTGATNLITRAYDADGELLETQEIDCGAICAYQYTYNSLGQQTSVDNLGSGPTGSTGTPGVPDVVLTASYDADGNRRTLSASLSPTAGGTQTADFVDSYGYDAQNREVSISQAFGAVDYVEGMKVGFGYNADGQVAGISRWSQTTSDPTTGSVVATSSYSYDCFGRVTTLAQVLGASNTPYTTDAWTYDADSHVQSYSNSVYDGDNISSYSYDKDGQLTGDTATMAWNSVANAFDPNGNPTSMVNVPATSIRAKGNTLLYDGAQSYVYDPDGNVVLSWQSLQAESAPTSTDRRVMAYQWDARGRLVQVTIYASGSDYLANPKVPKEIVDYTYDMFNNLIGRTDTTYAGGIQTGSTTQCYVYDGANPVLAFNGSGCLTDRYLFGPAVDQVLADEYFGGSTTLYPTTYGRTWWALTDNQNSVTDLVTDYGGAVEHIDYSPFGQPVLETVSDPATYDPLSPLGNLPTGYNFPIGYTGAYTDPVTNLQLHGLRWYNPVSQRWLSEDPSGLARDPNLYRYCSNSPVNATDPNGQWGLVDDAFAMGTGFVYGVVGQGVGDLLSGHLSSWENYVGAGVGGAAAAETMLYTANPVLAGMASGAASNATMQGLLMAEGKQQSFDLSSFAMATGMGGLGGLVGSMMNNATAPLGRMLSNGLQGSLPLSPVTSCYIVSTLMSGVNGMLTGGALGGMMGGFQGYISHGWEGVLDGMYAGMAKGAGQGLANGLIMAAIDPFICFTAGTLVHKAGGKEVIESLGVGQRVLTEGTKDSAGLPGDDPTEVDPRTWRLVRLQTAKPAGGDNLVDVELLRPLAWIEQTRAVVGSRIRFELAELGIDSPACVLAIEPCPEIEPGRGRVITGTFTTARCALLELHLSNGEALEPTPPHRFYSGTRQDWVAAQELRIGECLRTANGQAVTVESTTLKAGEHRVYNLEVEQEHQFYVGESGVLVHNEYFDSPSAQAVHDKYVKEVLGDALGEVKQKAFHPLGDDANALGTRRYDAFDPATGTAFEGNTTPWEQVTPEKLQVKLEQAASDMMNLADPLNPVKRVVWFGTEPLPTSGPASQLREALNRARIPYWVVKT